MACEGVVRNDRTHRAAWVPLPLGIGGCSNDHLPPAHLAPLPRCILVSRHATAGGRFVGLQVLLWTRICRGALASFGEVIFERIRSRRDGQRHGWESQKCLPQARGRCRSYAGASTSCRCLPRAFAHPASAVCHCCLDSWLPPVRPAAERIRRVRGAPMDELGFAITSCGAAREFDALREFRWRWLAWHVTSGATHVPQQHSVLARRPRLHPVPSRSIADQLPT